MGVDVLMAGIGRIMDPSLGLRILLAGTILSASMGYAKLSLLRNKGLWHPAVILIPLTLFSFSMILGFLNFVLAASILPWAIYWYEKNEGATARFVNVLLFTLVLFFCHLMVAALLLIIVAAKLASHPKGKEKLIGIGSVGGALLMIAVLYKVSSVSTEASTIVFSTIVEKLKFFFSCMSFGPGWMATNGLTFLAFGALLIIGFSGIKRDDKIVLFTLLGFYAICPFGFKITANMDGRIPAILFTLFLATLRYEPSGAFQARFKSASIAFFIIVLVNLVSIFAVIRRGDQEARKMRGILREIPEGDTLFIADISQWRADHRANWYPAYRMLAFYTAIDRPIFISGLFSYPSQQPVILKPELQGVGYATRAFKESDTVESQVRETMSEIRPRLTLMKKLGINKSWIFFVNYESTGYSGIQIPGKVYEDKNYVLAHVDN